MWLTQSHSLIFHLLTLPQTVQPWDLRCKQTRGDAWTSWTLLRPLRHSFNISPISLIKFNFCECLTKKCNFLSSIKLRIWHPVPEPNRPIPLWQDVLNRFFPCVGTHHWYSLNSKVQVHKGEMLERNCQIFLVVETDPCTIFEEDSFIFFEAWLAQ